MEHPLVGRSRVRSFARAGERTSPFQCINLSRPPSSSILRFPQSDAHSLIHSFVCSLLAHCAKVHSGKRTKVSQRRGEKKERRKRRFASKRRGGGRRERMCALLAFTESAVVQRNRITLHTIERMAANFRSSSFAATRQPTTFCRTQFQSWARLGV